jgi:integrase/recombinase XerC
MTDLIASHLTHCRAGGLAQTTLRTRLEVLRRADRELPLGLNEATTEELAAWLANPAWSAQTRATYFTHLTGYYRWGADPARAVGLDFDPSIGLNRPRRPRGLPRPATDDQAAYALTTLPEPYRLFVQFAVYAGLRSAEVAQVDRGDVTERSGITVVGKGGKHRRVPTHAMLWAAVSGLPPGPVAVSGGRRLNAYKVCHRVAYHLDQIGLPRLTMHSFRHLFATNLLKPTDDGGAGANLRVVQELLGHSSPDTTAIYTYVTDGQREMAIRALPALAPAPR